MTPNLDPAALAILEAINDSKGPVTFSGLRAVAALPDYDKVSIGKVLQPLIDELGSRSANGVLHLVEINHAGLEYVARVRRERADPIARAKACRDALLAWVPTATTNGVVEHVSAFEHHPAAHVHGSFFTTAEIEAAANWLASERLVIAHRSLAGMSLQLHHRGLKVLENWNGDTGMWDRQANGGNAAAGNTYISVGAGAQVGAVVGRDNSGTITTTLALSTGLKVQDIQSWLAAAQALIPNAGIEPGQLVRVEEAIAQLQAELIQPTPREGPVRRFGQAVLEELAKGAASLALPHLLPAVIGLIEAGKALF